MILVVKVLAAFVAIEHVWFAILEMVFFAKPLGRRIFKSVEAPTFQAVTLAKNQGLYNLFLAAGLVWGIVGDEPFGGSLRLFFFGCVLVAGVFGGITVGPRIFLLQAAPAATGLVCQLLAR
jgi:putative membrane protein